MTTWRLIQLWSRLTICLLLLSLSSSQSCFPMEDIFLRYRTWDQQMSLTSRRVYRVGVEGDDIMEVEEYSRNHRTTKYRIICDIAYGGNRYLVKRETAYGASFQCIHLEQLSQFILRISRSDTGNLPKRINCLEDTYMADPVVLIAVRKYFTDSCPLIGGFQLYLDVGSDSSCKRSMTSYSPSIQFKCDYTDSGSVVLDFGPDCLPRALAASSVFPREQYLFRMACVGGWEKNEITSLILKMQGVDNMFWCLVYRPFSTAENFHLTLDGSCLRRQIGPGDTNVLSGILVPYLQANHLQCTTSSGSKCKNGKDVCSNPSSCPKQCGRCQKYVDANRFCQFSHNLTGTWSTLSPDIKITINGSGVSGTYGQFSCFKESLKFSYTLVQTGGDDAVCQPTYACAHIENFATDMLVFRIRPSMRNGSGELIPCEKNTGALFYGKPRAKDEPKLLISSSELKVSSCNISSPAVYPTTYKNCKLLVRKCSGDCQTLTVAYDRETCSNKTYRDEQIAANHTCYGTVKFKGQTRGIIAKSWHTDDFHCWLFTSSYLYILAVEDCNPISAERIVSDSNSLREHDPLKTLTIQAEDQENSAHGSLTHSILTDFLLLMLYFIFITH
ncbi:uncharacterized protein LOC131949043 [Physella acuta]|uniref:uncharacterized protein LOC131949043 n=1 Tax=Physella acuta TaxID=109671 RepID=UPI0027DAF220|nr:uncharacterized protein LOC131949043 [Physella acuta]